jgi:hypothetical protein
VLSGVALIFARQIRTIVARLIRSLRGLSRRDKFQEQDEV